MGFQYVIVVVVEFDLLKRKYYLSSRTFKFSKLGLTIIITKMFDHNFFFKKKLLKKYKVKVEKFKLRACNFSIQ